MRQLIVLAILLLLPLDTQAEQRKASQKDRISFIKIDESASKVEVPVKAGGQQLATVILVKNDSTWMWSASLRRNNEKPVSLKGFEWTILQEIGTVNLDGREEVFVVLAEAGSGYTTMILNLINVSSSEVVGMSIGNNRTEKSTNSDVETTANFNDPKFRKEKEFLDKIKAEYGYVSGAPRKR